MADRFYREKAVGGHDVCHTCAAHCVVIEDLEARIRELLEERQNWIEQAEQGVMVEHDCPAMYACASIIADAEGSKT